MIESVEVVESTKDHRPETNLNQAIMHLSRDPTNYIAFLNDDTYLHEQWHEAMQHASQSENGKTAYEGIAG